MRPKIIVYAPQSIPPLEVPEFDVEWVARDIAVREFMDPRRGQCRADIAVEALAGYKLSVYVLDCDGYYPGFNFLFGLAVPKLKTAIVFTHRLKGPRFLERLVKEITHEAGHLFGLGHCGDSKCAMSFSNSVAEVDLKTPYFCNNCRRRLFRL